jgi:ubiquinone biosynthesis protein COQ9
MLFDSPETKHQILAEFLKICPFDGWNNGALLKAMEACGIDENFLSLIFENGCVDLAEFYVESQNQKSAEILENLSGKKIRDKIRLSLYARFEVEKNHKIALQRLANFYSNPKNFLSFEMGARPMIQGLKSCYKIADFIWKNIADQSTDFNFYTKRLTLGKIIFRTFFVFLKDESDNLQKTKNFIDAEIEKVMKFEKHKAQFRKFSAVTKKTCGEFFLDEKGQPKSPKDFIKNLPFFRLIKK